MRVMPIIAFNYISDYGLLFVWVVVSTSWGSLRVGRHEEGVVATINCPPFLKPARGPFRMNAAVHFESPRREYGLCMAPVISVANDKTNTSLHRSNSAQQASKG